jgi:hypothetical protein
LRLLTNFDHYKKGIFLFRLWKSGEWVNIIIDDFLPVSQETGELLYARSTQANEAWISLLEKAAAKLYGSYQHLNQAGMRDCVVDIAGMPDCIDLIL